MSRARWRAHNGFTLIALLVVIVVLGILAGVVVFAVRGVGNKGRDEAVATDARIIRTVQEPNQWVEAGPFELATGQQSPAYNQINLLPLADGKAMLLKEAAQVFEPEELAPNGKTGKWRLSERVSPATTTPRTRTTRMDPRPGWTAAVSWQ